MKSHYAVNMILALKANKREQGNSDNLAMTFAVEWGVG